MSELVFYVFFIVSIAMGGGKVVVTSSANNCEEFRAEIVAQVEELAPQHNDSVYVGPCQRIVLKKYSPKV